MKLKALLYIVAMCVMGGCLGGIFSCNRIQTNRPEEDMDSFLFDLSASMGDTSRDVVRKVDSMLQVTTDSFWYYRCLLLKSKIAFYEGRFDTSIVMLKQVERFGNRFAEDKRVFSIWADFFNMRGNIYGRKAQIDSMIWAFEKSYYYVQKSGNARIMPDICLNLADAYVRDGRYDWGAFWYRRSLSVMDSLRLPDYTRFPAYYGLAQVEMELRNFKDCDYYYDLAYQYFDRMRPYEKHIYLNNRGNSYYFRDDYQTALTYFRRSLALVSQYPELEFERNLTMVNLGEVFMLMNQTDSATYYLKLCYDYFHRTGNVSALYYIDTQLIELALKQGKVDLATRYLKQAVVPEYIEPNMLHIRNRYLEHYFAEKGDFRTAYRYQAENEKIDDSIRSERIRMRAEEIALKYKQDSTLMKKELLIQQQENEVLRLHQVTYGLASGLLLVLAVSALVVIYRKRKSDREQWNLQRAIAALRLENARNRISPHFIFNVLNRELASTQGVAQHNKLMNLAKLIRWNLELTDKEAVSLAEELDFVDTYVALESEGMEQFEYIRRIDDALSLPHVRIPSMLIQIPVENAIKHALRAKEGAKKLWVEVKAMKNNELEVIVCDNGGGYRRNSAFKGTGTGLKVITQTIQMLNACNKQPIMLTVENVSLENGEQGCRIRFTIPLNYSYQLR